ncbi:MAG: hypothetical protein NZ920_03800 [Aigarchaeota archaeon]|nr:hypothetical protein [Aigarchaeota archaeon]MDW8092255.1 inositol monophosphatase family protein [Nitrososphaerota archaeon]
MDEDFISDVIREALLSAHQAYNQLRRRGISTKPVGKGAYGDLSYLADVVCEEAIMRVLERSLSSVTFVSEESGLIRKGSELVVVIDPIDGSTNMSRSIPYFSSGIALSKSTHYNDVFASGVIDMISGDMTVAVEGKVSTSGEDVRRPTSLSEALMTVDPRAVVRGPPYDQRYLALLPRVKHVRLMGSALLELLNVVRGLSDGFVTLSRELRIMDFVPVLYMIESIGLPFHIEGESVERLSLSSTEKYGVIACSNEILFQEVLSACGMR